MLGLNITFASDVSPIKGTVLPETSVELTVDCQRLMMEVKYNSLKIKELVFEKRGTYTSTTLNNKEVDLNDIMGCGIKTGAIPLWMVPFYARYILEFIIGITGIISVGGIIYGGYLYLISGLSDNKEKGKNALMYGVVGFVITLIAWAIVNVVLALLTG